MDKKTVDYSHAEFEDNIETFEIRRQIDQRRKQIVTTEVRENRSETLKSAIENHELFANIVRERNGHTLRTTEIDGNVTRYVTKYPARTLAARFPYAFCRTSSQCYWTRRAKENS